MGSSYSYAHTNLASDCTSFGAGKTGTVVCWGDSIRVGMGEFGDTSDEHSHWSVDYEIGRNKCGFALEAHHNKNGVERATMIFSDSTGNTVGFRLDIERDGSGGLCCEVNGDIPGITSTKAYQNCLIETTTLSHGCSQREGLLVMEKRKNINYENAYMVTLAHYYVTQDVGFSAVAKVRTNKGDGSGLEVEGPYKHPGKDLRMVLVQTCRSRAWTPTACPHCCPTPQRPPNSGVFRFFRRFLKLDSSNNSVNTVGEPMNYPSYYGNVAEQSNTGLINNTGHTNGILNGAVLKVETLIIQNKVSRKPNYDGT